jgi:hypothetical protein
MGFARLRLAARSACGVGFARLRLARVGATAGIAAACASGSGIVYATGPGSTTGDGLVRIRWSQHGAEFVKPGAAFGSYRAVLLDELSIRPAPVAERPRRMATPHFEPTASYLDGMRRAYQEAFARQFGSDGMRLVSEPGPGVLRISGHVTDLLLTASLDPEGRPDLNEIVSSFGELTLLLDVRDAATGEPLLRTVDRAAIGPTSLHGVTRNTTGANLGAQRLLFRNQALLLRQQIGELARLGSVPAPAE